MILSNIPSAQALVLSFKAWDVKHIVISPGSRNAPLVLSFTQNPFFTCYSIVDERCAAFFAMGMAQQLQEPVAVICTSGSAVLNYYPAVAEAFYSMIPLIVVSADRPQYKIDIGDGQTIRQENVLEPHVGYTANLRQDPDHAKEIAERHEQPIAKEDQKMLQHFNAMNIKRAVKTAIESRAPVHINIVFEEPLYGTTSTPSVPIPKIEDIKPIPAIEDDSSLKTSWNFWSRKIILIGAHSPNLIEKEILDALAQDDSIVVLTETTANLHHPEFFSDIDSMLVAAEKATHQKDLLEQLKPGLLITFGGMLVSKKVKQFLRTYPAQSHWHIDPRRLYDTFLCPGFHLKTEPNDFFKMILKDRPVKESDYKSRWRRVQQHCKTRQEAYLEQIPFSDFSVFKQLLPGIPKAYQVQLSNSTAVRYTQFFPMHPSWHIYCNRGTAGIDGSTSTAVGAAIHHANPTLLITGDLSFFYDSNALWNNYIRSDFRIIIINNGGGGIFKWLPGHQENEVFHTFFETQHQLTAEHLAKMHGLDYYTATNTATLAQQLQTFYEASERPKILEIHTPKDINAKVYAEYFKFLPQGL